MAPVTVSVPSVAGEETVDTTDGKGRVVDFRNTLVVMTSNLCQDERFAPRPDADEATRREQEQELVAEVRRLGLEFGIGTPYTSFLVLESDADRERFGVQKRFRMRDGEEFFALVVDQVGDVVAVDADRVEPAPATLPGVWRDAASGVIQMEEELLVILDVDHILDSEVSRAA